MKRLISALLSLFLLVGCGQRVIAPAAHSAEPTAAQTAAVLPTAPASAEPATPIPTEPPQRSLPMYAPKGTNAALFCEELISLDGEPLGSKIHSLLTAKGLSKAEYFDRFTEIVLCINELSDSVRHLLDEGRTLTESRRERTVAALTELLSEETLSALQDAYSNCQGEGQELPVGEYAASLEALLKDVQRMESREVPFYSLDADGANDYRIVLSRYMGEPVVPLEVFQVLEALLQTEAYALAAALQMDPEAPRKKEPISLGSYEQNMAFLTRVAQELCPLPDGGQLVFPPKNRSTEKMDLLELAFRVYPGMAWFKAYADRTPKEQQVRWAYASDGYLAGLAIHGSNAVIPYLDSFGLDYVQYRWYEDMLYATLTGMSALLIHYYGYSEKELAAYLQGWGAQEYVDYLYEKAMFDPFESLVASYGYYQYLDICEAAMAVGCESEQRFLQDYLAVGPAPFEPLKEYMVGLYENAG